MADHIDYFFSMLSPWAYLGHQAFHDIVSRTGVTVSYRPVDLGPVFAGTGGIPLGERHPARQHYRLIELQRWRDRRGLPLNLHPAHFPFPVQLLDRCVIAADRAGADVAALMERIFRAIWVEDRNMGDPGTIAECLGEAGLAADEILAAADSAEIVAEYDRNRADGIAHEIIGSPCYLRDGEPFWGQDRLDLLEDAIRSARPPYRAG